MSRSTAQHPRWTETGYVAFRLNSDETTKLSAMLKSDVAGSENPGEWFRMLVHREWNRRHNLPRPTAKDWQTAFRQGRPQKV